MVGAERIEHSTSFKARGLDRHSDAWWQDSEERIAEQRRAY
jgi:hypothetical protein